MKIGLRLGAFLAAMSLLAACGSQQDRAAMARDTVSKYWYNVDHMKLDAAYKMLTPGTRQSTKKSDYEQAMLGQLKATAGISVTLHKPKVDGDQARVLVTLHSPKTTVTKDGCQTLFWVDDHWQISDAYGGLSPAIKCKG